ncbi:unnamed protein product [Cyprideis torosa]|uniref:Uncharacterized protein n=1 Tax=Cyprideis torosa TaxID=163714 RepID=A0A7R8WJF1_9CRUS|nr:unnamed protein product [Cyprideis torosa]CAG0899104.1 unnamed protein product [Cyprideis torosa]
MKPDSLTPSASSPALPILRDQHCADSEDTLMAGEETYAPAAAVASSPHPHGSHLAYLHRPTPTNSPSRLPTKQERMDDEDGLTPVEEPTDLSLPSSLRNREASTESPSAWRKTPPVANWKEGTPSPRSHSPYSLPLPP